jgi:putative glutamine amidotransferase
MPMIGLATCIKYGEGTSYHALAAQYLPSIVEASRCLPVPIPALTDSALVSAYLDRISGLVLPGSVSNVDPLRYGRPRTPEAEPQDMFRDAAIFRLVELAIARGLPILAICRGFQELNVACGGTLHAELHNQPGRRDHREPDLPGPDDIYRHAHNVHLTEGSALARAGFPSCFPVCSLHRQGVDRLGDGLRAEALADDGTVEMVTMPAARGFVLGVQWHPEYLYANDVNSVRIFRLFGNAVRAWATGQGPRPLATTLEAALA